MENGGETLDIPLNVIVWKYYCGGAYLENKLLMVIDFTVWHHLNLHITLFLFDIPQH